jgi:hypothetical protein
MAGMSRFYEAANQAWVKGTPFPSPPAALYLTTYTVMLDDLGAGGTEQTTSGFSRQLFTLGADFVDTDGKLTSQASADVSFGPNSSPTVPVGPLVGWAIWSAPTGGTLLFSDLFRDDAGTPITKTIAPGDKLNVSAAALKVKFTLCRRSPT